MKTWITTILMLIWLLPKNCLSALYGYLHKNALREVELISLPLYRKGTWSLDGLDILPSGLEGALVWGFSANNFLFPCFPVSPLHLRCIILLCYMQELIYRIRIESAWLTIIVSIALITASLTSPDEHSTPTVVLIILFVVSPTDPHTTLAGFTSYGSLYNWI